MEVNRIGKVTEYKEYPYYLTIAEWEDGHIEIELHRCIPQQLFYSCDRKHLEVAKDLFQKLSTKQKPLIEEQTR